MSASSFALGQKAQVLTNKSIGIVRYIGTLHFIEGDWLGLEMPDASGKNDGEVQGQRYFTCSPNHGIFVRAANATPIAEPTPVVAAPRKVAPRPSIATVPITSSAPTAKKPTTRLSMAPPAKRQGVPAVPTGRLSMKGPTSSILKTIPAGSKGHLSPIRPASTSRLSVSAASSAAPTASGELSEKATPSDSDSEYPGENFSVAENFSTAQAALKVEPAKNETRKISGATSVASLNAQLEVLRRQVKTLVAESAEKDEQIRSAKSEKDKYASILQTLEAKIRPQSEEISQLRKQLEEATDKLKTSEHEKEEAVGIAEFLTIEKANQLEAAEKLEKERDELLYKVDDLKVSLEILEEEKTTIQELVEGETGPDDVIRLKIENERTREALLRLRDVTRSEKKEDDAKIKQLEEENAGVEKLKEDLADTQAKLAQALETIELQKAQIDSVDTQETIVMDLQSKFDNTEKALAKCKHDLDQANTLVSLSNQDLDVYMEDITKWYELCMLAIEDIGKLQHTRADQDVTIDKFRKWSAELQLNLRQLQGSQDISQQEKIELEKKNQQYKELAFKSQSSAFRTQNTQLQQSLIKARADIVEKQNDILKVYARHGFNDAARPIEALQITTGINLKVGALQQYLKSKLDQPLDSYNEADKLCRPHCIVYLGRISLISSYVDTRFQTATVDTFLNFGEACQELTEVEEQVDSWTKGLIRGDLGETDLKLQSHNLSKVLHSLLVQRFGSKSKFGGILDNECDLEYIVSGLGSVKMLLTYLEELPATKLQFSPDAEDEENQQFENYKEELAKNRRVILNAERQAKEALEQVQLLTQRKMYIEPDVLLSLSNTVQETDHVLDHLLNHTEDFWKVITQEREKPVTFSEIKGTANLVFYEYSKNLAWLNTRASQLVNIVNDPENLIEFLEEDNQLPWVEHSLTLDAQEAELRDAAQELTATKAELVEKNTTIVMKDKIIDELNVNVEVLNKRVNSSGAQNDRIVELERAVKANDADKENLVECIKVLQHRLDEGATQVKETTITVAPTAHSPATLSQRMSIDLVKRQNEALASTLRAAVIKNQNIVDFEQLDQPKKPESTLAQRTQETLAAVYAAKEKLRKENAKKKSMARKEREAKVALRNFRKVMRK